MDFWITSASPLLFPPEPYGLFCKDQIQGLAQASETLPQFDHAVLLTAASEFILKSSFVMF